MAYDEGLAQRVREAVRHPALSERKMFGGICFMVGGHMAAGVVGDDLMVRVGPDAYEAALAEPAAREMDFTGRVLRNMVYVSAQGVAADSELERWVGLGVAYASSRPPK